MANQNSVCLFNVWPSIYCREYMYAMFDVCPLPWFRVSKRLKRQRVEGAGGGGGRETLVQPEHDLLLVQIKESDRFMKLDRQRKINRFNNYAATFDKFVV